LSGLSGSIGVLASMRGGWGLGNALFVATALSIIVGAASGGLGNAITLYEAALGPGISSGPLLGAALGSMSWRYPFFGTAALMALAVILTATLVRETGLPEQRGSARDTLKALRDPGLLTLSLGGMLYSFGFFVLLAYTPLLLRLSAQEIGLIFLRLGRAGGSHLGLRGALAARPLWPHYGRTRSSPALRARPRRHDRRSQAGVASPGHRLGRAARDQQRALHQPRHGGLHGHPLGGVGRLQLPALGRGGRRARAGWIPGGGHITPFPISAGDRKRGRQRRLDLDAARSRPSGSQAQPGAPGGAPNTSPAAAQSTPSA
jgi:hypothetical protein